MHELLRSQSDNCTAPTDRCVLWSHLVRVNAHEVCQCRPCQPKTSQFRSRSDLVLRKLHRKAWHVPANSTSVSAYALCGSPISRRALTSDCTSKWATDPKTHGTSNTHGVSCKSSLPKGDHSINLRAAPVTCSCRLSWPKPAITTQVCGLLPAPPGGCDAAAFDAVPAALPAVAYAVAAAFVAATCTFSSMSTRFATSFSGLFCAAARPFSNFLRASAWSSPIGAQARRTSC